VQRMLCSSCPQRKVQIREGAKVGWGWMRGGQLCGTAKAAYHHPQKCVDNLPTEVVVVTGTEYTDEERTSIRVHISGSTMWRRHSSHVQCWQTNVQKPYTELARARLVDGHRLVEGSWNGSRPKHRAVNVGCRVATTYGEAEEFCQVEGCGWQGVVNNYPPMRT